MYSKTSLNSAAATVNATNAAPMKAPSGVKTTAEAANEALTAKTGIGMGQKYCY